ncbi:MAG: DUF2191 domain-containing protein [Candidatus Solibacter usitatus]|nr:DUF2191 domain-containing protein [Candidatus Solibacter usitatus]
MRTTIHLEDPLLREAKKVAAESGITLTALLSDALREALIRRKASRKAAAVHFTTVRGKARPGVDLDNSAALLDLMERADDAR